MKDRSNDPSHHECLTTELHLAPCSTGRKEMFYLTMHSTHFIYGYMASDIWLRTILIVRKETCCRHIGYSFRLAARVLTTELQQGFFYMHHPTDRIAHTTAFVTPVMEYWMEQWNSSVGPPHEGSIRRPIAPWANALNIEVHLAPHKTLESLLFSNGKY